MLILDFATLENRSNRFIDSAEDDDLYDGDEWWRIDGAGSDLLVKEDDVEKASVDAKEAATRRKALRKFMVTVDEGFKFQLSCSRMT